METELNYPRKVVSKPMSEETKKKLSESLRRKWASGERKRNPKSGYVKSAKSLKKAHKEGRISLPPKEVRVDRSRKGGETMTAKKLKSIRTTAKKRRGVPGVGGSGASELNAHSHQWTIRSPKGEIYRFTNLSHWARHNERLFLPDGRPTSKKPLWQRIANGIAMLYEVNGRCCSYRGWTAVSRLELVNWGDDLLGRDTSPENDKSRSKSDADRIKRAKG